MTGPEHYKEAEELIDGLQQFIDANPAPAASEAAAAQRAAFSMSVIARAQVHATLALTAATVDAAYGQMSGAADRTWGEVACA